MHRGEAFRLPGTRKSEPDGIGDIPGATDLGGATDVGGSTPINKGLGVGPGWKEVQFDGGGTKQSVGCVMAKAKRIGRCVSPKFENEKRMPPLSRQPDPTTRAIIGTSRTLPPSPRRIADYESDDDEEEQKEDRGKFGQRAHTMESRFNRTDRVLNERCERSTMLEELVDCKFGRLEQTLDTNNRLFVGLRTTKSVSKLKSKHGINGVWEVQNESVGTSEPIAFGEDNLFRLKHVVTGESANCLRLSVG